MLKDQVLMELANSSYLIAGIKLYVPVSTGDQVLQRLFEYFLRGFSYRCKLFCLQIVLVGGVLKSNFEFCQVLFGAISTSDISCKFRVDTARVHLGIRRKYRNIRLSRILIAELAIRWVTMLGIRSVFRR